MNLGLKDKVVMVAASSQGIGFGVAEACAKEGARLSIASRSAEGIEKAAAKLRSKYGGEVLASTFDASNRESIERWSGATLEHFGAIDSLLVNAGGPPAGTFLQNDDAVWQKAFELTLLSAVRMIRSVLPQMQKQRSGSIVTVTSTSVKEPIEILLLSNVLRSGVVSLVKSLSNEFAGQGIRINNLVPGRIETDRVKELDQANAERRKISSDEQRESEMRTIPLGRYGTIEEFGAAAAFLLSDAASYITGANLLVDGGKTKTVW